MPLYTAQNPKIYQPAGSWDLRAACGSRYTSLYWWMPSSAGRQFFTPGWQRKPGYRRRSERPALRREQGLGLLVEFAPSTGIRFAPCGRHQPVVPGLDQPVELLPLSEGEELKIGARVHVIANPVSVGNS